MAKRSSRKLTNGNGITPLHTQGENSDSDAFNELGEEDPVKALYQKFAHFKKEWPKTQAGKATSLTMRRRILNRADIMITSAMCLGIGSMSTCDSINMDYEPLSQLAAFACWLDLLKTRFTIPTIYFQDPAFTKTDVRLLHMLGFSCIWSNASHFLATDSTFLFAPYCPWRHVLPLFIRVSPPLFIGADLYADPDSQYRNRHLEYLLQQAPVRKFFESRGASKTPFDTDLERHLWWLGGMKMYWKRITKGHKDKNVKEFYRTTRKINIDDLGPTLIDADDFDTVSEN